VIARLRQQLQMYDRPLGIIIFAHLTAFQRLHLAWLLQLTLL